MKNKRILLWVVVATVLLAIIVTTICICASSKRGERSKQTQQIKREKVVVVTRVFGEGQIKAANEGDAEAQLFLGRHYCEEKDYVAAAQWYRKAAEQGNLEAPEELGNIYYEGRGVKRDWNEALKWYFAAAELYDNEQLTSDYNRTHVMPHDFKHRQKDIHNRIGEIYACGGFGVERDKVEADKWYFKVVEYLHKSSSSSDKMELAEMYFDGRGVDKNALTGVKLCRKAANMGSRAAAIRLSYCYCDGEGVPASIFMAAIWWLKSGEWKYYPLTVIILWFLLFAIGCIKKLFK